jgi:uncharacterized FAD-dependent dehydrogenase
MSTITQLKLSPEQVSNDDAIRIAASEVLKIPIHEIQHIRLLRKSMDARSRSIWFNLRVEVFLVDEDILEEKDLFKIQKKQQSTCHIIGFGPAGIFAALQCIEHGIKPIILERGKAVEKRIADIAAINKQGLINHESNYCYIPEVPNVEM